MMADSDTIALRRTIVDGFREHRSTMYGIARRYVGEDHASDVIQNTFVRLWTNPAGYDETRGNVRQYLCTITRGMSIDHLRRLNSQRRRDDRASIPDLDASDHPVQQLINHDTTRSVRAALAAIPATERQAVVATFYQGLTYRQTADHLGIPEGTAKSRIRSGLKNLRAELIQ